MSQGETIYDVMVIGAGFAGMAAALFAAKHGLSVAQAGATGGIDFSTGFIDVMGVHPVSEGRRWDDPEAAIRAVTQDDPEHPYALVDVQGAFDAVNVFTQFLAEQGQPYTGHERRNMRILSPVGTVKRTFRAPLSTWKGVLALEEKRPTLIVDFHGLKGFSGKQIKETLRKEWPALRTERVDFPGATGELYPEHMAWTMAETQRLDELVESVLPFVRDVEYVGFPAVLGLYDPMKSISYLENKLGKGVFEIPTMPPGVAGPRLRAAFDRGLPELGVKTFTQKLVRSVERQSHGDFIFEIGAKTAASAPSRVRAKSAILASGRFFGKGLSADRKQTNESVFGLPVEQPTPRHTWHKPEFLDGEGHPINRAGLKTDKLLRPLAEGGEPAYENLFAAGAILANQDWMRQKCGAGLAVATAHQVVRSLAEFMK